MILILYSLAAFFLTSSGVEVFRRWSLRKEILDIPNERSSHKQPIPRGGGLPLVCVCLVLFAAAEILTEGKLRTEFYIGAILIAAVSWFDDLKSLSPVVRFFIHSAAAALAIYAYGFWEKIYLPIFGEIYFGYFGAILTFLWIVWLTNAYNFMDGIDGIAAVQCLTAGIGWLLGGIVSEVEFMKYFGAATAFSGLGFLIHNWQPAKIFMGDVGSAFLGYIFAVFPLLMSHKLPHDKNLWAVFGVLCVWMFVFDTVFTFTRRILRGEKFWQAHRSHLYQRLVIGGKSHAFVTIIYGISAAIVTVTGILFLKETPFGEYSAAILCLAVACGLIFFVKKLT